MSRYIDADAFLERMKGTDRYFSIKFDIDAQPTVDAVEVVHGEWKFCEDDFYGEATYKCSNCGEELVTLNGVEIDWNYCPECGAKMDGKKVE
jgi:DNA-directed RNA polymerase subunit RPC12/RpoP